MIHACTREVDFASTEGHVRDGKKLKGKRLFHWVSASEGNSFELWWTQHVFACQVAGMC